MGYRKEPNRVLAKVSNRNLIFSHHGHPQPASKLLFTFKHLGLDLFQLSLKIHTNILVTLYIPFQEVKSEKAKDFDTIFRGQGGAKKDPHV